jgi:uncharacterized protein
MLHGGTSAATLLPVTGYVSLCTQAIERQTMADIERWRVHLAESREDIRRVLENTRRIAVLGMKPDFTGQPAYYVPEYAKRSGYEVIPVPVYFPEITEMLGEPVYRRLADVPGQIDMVNVFRRAHDIPPHVDDILAARPKSVWFQLGIRNNEVAERLAKEGIDVVQDRCLLVELNAIGR